MVHERLFKLEREAEQRVHEARDREIDLGGSGSARRASEAMNAPMLEVAKIRKTRQRFGDLQMAIDHNSNLVQDFNQDIRMPSDVKRHQIRQTEQKLAGLNADYKALEAETEQRLFGGAPQVVEAVTKVRDDADASPESSRERRERVRAPEDFSEPFRQQAGRLVDRAGSFHNEGNLTNIATEQYRRSRIEDGVVPHLLVPQRGQKRALEELQRYADADPETRREMNRESRLLAREEARKLNERKKRLAESEEAPKWTEDSGARAVRELGDIAGKAVGKAPGVKQIAGATSVLERTLKDKGYDPEDPDSVADAMFDRGFQDALQENLHKYWRDTAKKAATDLFIGTTVGNAVRWRRKNIIPR